MLRQARRLRLAAVVAVGILVVSPLTFLVAQTWLRANGSLGARSGMKGLSRPPIVLATIAKDEPRILEWIAYHVQLGFDHIYVYDNAPTTEPCFPSCIQKFLPGLNPFVTVIPFPEAQKAQQKAYTNFTRSCIPGTWVLLIDVDEYLVLDQMARYRGVGDFLFSVLRKQSSVNSIVLTRRQMGTQGHRARLLENESELWIRTYTELHDFQLAGKSFLKCSLGTGPITDNIHVPAFEAFHGRQPLILTNALGRVVLPQHAHSSNGPTCRGVCPRNAWIAHFRFVNVQQIVAKSLKGDAFFPFEESFCRACSVYRFLHVWWKTQAGASQGNVTTSALSRVAGRVERWLSRHRLDPFAHASAKAADCVKTVEAFFQEPTPFVDIRNFRHMRSHYMQACDAIDPALLNCPSVLQLLRAQPNPWVNTSTSPSPFNATLLCPIQKWPKVRGQVFLAGFGEFWTRRAEADGPPAMAEADRNRSRDKP